MIHPVASQGGVAVSDPHHRRNGQGPSVKEGKTRALLAESSTPVLSIGSCCHYNPLAHVF